MFSHIPLYVDSSLHSRIQLIAQSQFSPPKLDFAPSTPAASNQPPRAFYTSMPYLIWVPHDPRPFVTNDPRIFVDAKLWSWQAESRPYTDALCNTLRRQEDALFEYDRRAAQLERYWAAEVERRKVSDEVAPVMKMEIPTKHAKHDSVQSVLVEVKEVEIGEDGENWRS
jgi:hypothetical protein